MSEDKFFGRTNIHRAAWALIIAASGFIGAMVYYKVFGPQKVVVDTSNTQNAPLVVTLKEPAVVNLGPTAEDIRNLSQAIRAFQTAQSKDGNEAKIAALTAELKRLRDSVSLTQSSASVPSIHSPVPAVPTPTSGRFKLPRDVKGYMSASLNGTRDSTCPTARTSQGELLNASFRLVDSTLRSKASPLFIRVDRIDGPSNSTQIVEETQPLQEGLNTIEVRPSLDPSQYQVSYGYYLLSELHAEYPKFYARNCIISVVK